MLITTKSSTKVKAFAGDWGEGEGLSMNMSLSQKTLVRKIEYLPSNRNIPEFLFVLS